MSKRSSSPHGLGHITPEELSKYYDLKLKQPSWSQWFRLSNAPQHQYDEDDLEKARKDLATNPEQKAILSKILEEKTRDRATEQNLRDFLKKERADLATAAEKEKRRQQQQIADKQPIRPADPEEVERTAFFGLPINMRQKPSVWIGRGVHNFFTNHKGRGGKSKRVKSRRVKSKRNKRRTQHRNTRK
jgi:hypothetical protein